jgi:hypothetical protein
MVLLLICGTFIIVWLGFEMAQWLPAYENRLYCIACARFGWTSGPPRYRLCDEKGVYHVACAKCGGTSVIPSCTLCNKEGATRRGCLNCWNWKFSFNFESISRLKSSFGYLNPYKDNIINTICIPSDESYLLNVSLMFYRCWILYIAEWIVTEHRNYLWQISYLELLARTFSVGLLLPYLA